MPVCNEYRVNISTDSPVHGLYEELKNQRGMEDKDLDHGYHVINYSEPGRQPALTGAQDCTIEAEEVLESVDIFDRYCSLVRGGAGCKNPIEITDPATNAKIQAAIQIAKDALGQQDDLDIKMGTAMFYFAGMPTAEQLGSLSKKQIKNFNDKLASLDKIGLEKFGSYLKENGGLGLFLMYRDNILETNAGDSIVRGRGGDTEKAKILYSLFKKAGLKPQFAEADMTGSVKASSFERIRPIIVALEGKSFDPVEKFYPMEPRHYMIAEIAKCIGSTIEFRDDRAAGDSQVSSITISEEMVRRYNDIPAVETVIKLSGNDSTSYRSWLLLGHKQLEDGEMNKAEEYFKKAVQINSFCWEAYYFLGRACSKQKKYAEAREALNRSLELNPKHAWAHLELGRIFEATGETEQAIMAFTSAVEAEPYFPDGLYALAEVLYNSGDSAAALENISKALSLDIQYAKAHHLRGKIFKESGKFKEAAASLLESLKFAKSYWPLYSDLVPTLCQLNDEEKANETLNVFKVELGNASLTADKLSGLLEETKAIQKTCGAPQIYSAIFMMFGDRLMEGGGFEKALDAYSMAVQADTGDINLKLKRAMTLLLLNRPEEASKELGE